MRETGHKNIMVNERDFDYAPSMPIIVYIYIYTYAMSFLTPSKYSVYRYRNGKTVGTIPLWILAAESRRNSSTSSE
jgi:hypothetical protein